MTKEGKKDFSKKKMYQIRTTTKFLCQFNMQISFKKKEKKRLDVLEFK